MRLVCAWAWHLRGDSTARLCFCVLAAGQDAGCSCLSMMQCKRCCNTFARSVCPPTIRQVSARCRTSARTRKMTILAEAGPARAAAVKLISDSIRGIPDFPKPGILFWDITTLLLNPDAFKATTDLFVQRYKDMKVDVVAGFEARGFIFGPPIALALGVPFVPLRKPGKLPGETISEEYITEYSTDKIEMHTGAIEAGQRVLLVDDLIATGGTLRAGINLMRKLEAEVVEAACIIELPALHGRAKLEGVPLFVLIEKEGE